MTDVIGSTWIAANRAPIPVTRYGVWRGREPPPATLMELRFSDFSIHWAWAPVLIFAVAASAFKPACAAPYAPKHDATILEHLPLPSKAARRELRGLRAELDADPQNLTLATRLARRYISLGRAQADPRYNGYAQAALAPWWDLAKPPLDVLILRATLLQNRHEFDAALADLSLALSINPRNPQAWLTRAVILQVQGKGTEAMASCRRLAGMTDDVIVVTCLSSAASRSGQSLSAYRLLRETLSAADDMQPTVELWALTVLGEIAASLGRHGDAENHFLSALRLKTRDVYLLSAYADFLLDRGRAQEVSELLADEARVDGLLLRLALAKQRLNADGLGRHVRSLAARYAAGRRRADTAHGRDESRFKLHLLAEPNAALAIAKENWQVQREPWDARLVLEAALAARAPEEAVEVVEWLKKTGLQDVWIAALVQRMEASTP